MTTTYQLNHLNLFYLSVLVFFLLPEVSRKSAPKSGSNQRGIVSHLTSFSATIWTNLWDVFLVRFFVGLGIMVYRNNFNMWLDYSFGIKPSVTGYLTSYTGLMGTLSGFGVGYIAIYYHNDNKLLFHTAIVQFLSIASMVFIFDVYSLAFCLAPLSLANAVARVASANVLLTRAKNVESGEILGLGASVLSFARMLAPVLGGIAQEFHESGPVIMGAGLVFVGLAILFFSSEHNSQGKFKHR